MSPTAGSQMIRIIDKIGLEVQLTELNPVFTFDTTDSLQMIASSINEFESASRLQRSRSLVERHEECNALGNRKMSIMSKLIIALSVWIYF